MPASDAATPGDGAMPWATEAAREWFADGFCVANAHTGPARESMLQAYEAAVEKLASIIIRRAALARDAARLAGEVAALEAELELRLAAEARVLSPAAISTIDLTSGQLRAAARPEAG